MRAFSFLEQHLMREDTMTDQLTIPDIADLLREEIRGGTCSSVEELEERLYAFPGHDSEEIADALDGLTGNDGFDLYRAKWMGIECTFGNLVACLLPRSPERFWDQELDAPDFDLDSHDLMAEVSITWNEETESWEIWSDPRLGTMMRCSSYFGR